jgi:hypothetical protein
MKPNYILQHTSKMDTQSLIPIVPFGNKYKGKPVTDLLKDTQYLEWCKQQEWFKKYPIIYNICVNQTITTNNSDSRTPEHNRLQNMFLDKNTVKKLIYYYYLFKYNRKIPEKTMYRFNTVFEASFNWDILIENISMYECISDCNIDCNCVKIEMKPYLNDVNIEIKPLLGDDYPSVLRKMKTQMHLLAPICTSHLHLNCILLVKSFVSTNTSKEQLIEIFKQSNIHVFFFNEVFGEDVVSTEEKTSEDKPSNPNQIEDSENTILREKLFQAEQKIKELEEEILLLKKPKNTKTIQHYFTKT